MMTPEPSGATIMQTVSSHGGLSALDRLNVDCLCRTLDTQSLGDALGGAMGDAGFAHRLMASHPGLISHQPVYLSAAHAEQMREIITAVETVGRMPAVHDALLEQAPAIARIAPGPIGVFMGYDFHLGREGPRLIEINTNAGGALVNAYLLAAQRACCQDFERAFAPWPSVAETGGQFVATLHAEWARQGIGRPLQSVAIVDDAPERQYLYPEFQLFQRLFAAHGLTAVIADACELTWTGGQLMVGGQPIDLIYNRLTDFDLSEDGHTALRAAYAAGTVAVTPNPHAHALFADKRNLALLTDPQALTALGVPQPLIDQLTAGIAHTRRVTAGTADALWRDRNRLFFKPARGYGSKAAYRGEKITRRVWGEIQASDSVAQELVPPSGRGVRVDGERRMMKADLRCYTYDGAMLLMAARLYEGQTTNMRTPGGGFAPVLSAALTPDMDGATLEALTCGCA
jgi:hypothetical protein